MSAIDKTFIESLYEDAMSKMDEVGDAISDGYTYVKDGVANVIDTSITFVKDQVTSFGNDRWYKPFYNSWDNIYEDSESLSNLKNDIYSAVKDTNVIEIATNIWQSTKKYWNDNIVYEYKSAFENVSLPENPKLADVIGFGLGAISATTNGTINVAMNLLGDSVNLASSANNGIVSATNTAVAFIKDSLTQLGEYIPESSALGSVLQSVAGAAAEALSEYGDGISNTSFGSYMKESWDGSNSFLKHIASKSAGIKFKILESSPLDPGESLSNMYGSMMLGCPYLTTTTTDPRRRSAINTFIKDGKFLSLTPGLPKFYGTSHTNFNSNDIYHQTDTPEEMISYLLQNGLNESFANKDKRYYVFDNKYSDYYAYLETMLNTIWIKMGLANSADDEFNIFSFFEIGSGDNIDVSKADKLNPKYYSSIGFYCNPSGAVSESVSNSPTSIGGSMAGNINSRSDEFQQINYVSGMGTGSAAKNASRAIALGMNVGQGLLDKISENFTTTKSLVGAMDGRGIIAKLGAAAKGIGIDTSRINATQDFGTWIQEFSVTNGMKVVYPELWSDSSYSKSFSVSLSFTSPYGDPASIFKYVYVPFCALLCFALPRQAAENGMVSPFFVRADIPGLATSDLAFISDISWTKGGSNNLWTKDGLPRSIDVQITINDLYPFLAMTKRISFLSANPSYTVFLDSMCGLCSVYDSSTNNDPLNNYWRKVINRVNSYKSDFDGKLWNKFNSNKRTSNIYAMENRDKRFAMMNTDYSQIPWLHKAD